MGVHLRFCCVIGTMNTSGEEVLNQSVSISLWFSFRDLKEFLVRCSIFSTIILLPVFLKLFRKIGLL